MYAANWPLGANDSDNYWSGGSFTTAGSEAVVKSRYDTVKHPHQSQFVGYSQFPYGTAELSAASTSAASFYPVNAGCNGALKSGPIDWPYGHCPGDSGAQPGLFQLSPTNTILATSNHQLKSERPCGKDDKGALFPWMKFSGKISGQTRPKLYGVSV